MFEIFFDPTASAMAYGQRPKFFRAEHSATAEGGNCAYGPTLIKTERGVNTAATVVYLYFSVNPRV